jgi:succinate dehydrogenase / fumarate reductase, cytochrome b subunit
MYWSGPILLAFIVYHLMHLTLGVGGTEHEELNPYNNVVAGFSNPLVSGFYILSMGLLCLHLYHGVWSMFQTLGVNRPKWDGTLQAVAKGYAWLIFLGNISMPLAVLSGAIKMGPSLTQLGL